MSRVNPPDIAARKRIEKDLEINFLVEAGAGSGKTSSLVKRMVALVLSGKFSVGQIVAITFTRKAAAELKERFQTGLEEAYRDAKDPESSILLKKALLDLDRCFIGTIHSFCARMLRERPVEARLDPDFGEMDQLQERFFMERAWDEFLKHVRLNRQDLLRQLRKLGVSTADLKESFFDLSSYPDVEPVINRLPQPDLKKPLKQVEALVKKAVKAIPQKPDKDYDNLQKAVLRALRYIRYFDLEEDRNIAELLSSFAKNFRVIQNRWKSKDEAVKFRDEFAKLSEEVVDPALTRWREYRHFYLMEFLIEAEKYYENMRYELSLLNFQDLLMKTAYMLKNYAEVREYFQGKYRTLLVDEFQDTDPIQAEIMFYLTGADTAERDWHKLTPLPGSLFVVGDPKQSIYRFRRADIDTYNLVKKLIKESGGEVLDLTANFRSLEALGNWFNPLFEKLLPAEGSPCQAAYRPLETVRCGKEGASEGVRVLEIPAEFGKKDEIAEAEADYIARYVKWALAGNMRLARTPEEKESGKSEHPSPGDFMIILRYKDKMDSYARAMERYGIPVTMAGGSSLKDSVELKELLKLLEAICDPDNEVLLVAVLRGLFFGISDTELYRFKEAGGSFNIFADIPEKTDDEIKKLFSQAFEKLWKYYCWSKDYPPVAALEKIISDLGLVPYTLAEPLGKSRCAGIYQVLELLRASEGGAGRFSHLVEQFKTLLETNIEEELSILPGEEDAVKILNLHKAKGLEAPVVFLAQPYKKFRLTAEKHIRRTGGFSEGFFLIGKKVYDRMEIIAQPQGWERYEEEELKYLEEEEKRLLYVAATRAKNLLVISRSLKDKDLKSNPWASLIELGMDDNTPSLEVPALQYENDAEEGEEIESSMLAEARERLEGWMSLAAESTYRTISPTDLAVDIRDLNVERGEGGGIALGNAVHRVLEGLVKGEDNLEELMEISLKQNGLEPERREELGELVEKFKNSVIWQRLRKADKILTEVPFSLELDSNHPFLKELALKKNVPVLLSGVIDLAFKEGDEWVIIDYKTDRVKKVDDLQILADHYAPQIRIYCGVFTEITREKVKEGEIYFIFHDTLKRLY